MDRQSHEVLKSISIVNDYTISARNEHLKQKYLCLVLLKFPEIDSQNFGIGLSLYHFIRFEKENMIFDFSMSKTKSARIGQTDWNNKMYKWSYYQWALFLINICKQIKYTNIIKIILPYKWIRIPSCNALSVFIDGIQKEFDKLIKKKKYLLTFKYKYTKISLAFDPNIKRDVVVNFDTDPFNLFYPLCKHCGFDMDESQKLKPAVSHGLLDKRIAVDYYGNRYKSHYDYIVEKRMLGAKKDKNSINPKDIMLANYIYRFLCEIHSDPLSQFPEIRTATDNVIKFGSRVRRLVLSSPWTTFRLYFSQCIDGDIMPLFPIPLLKHCEICQVIVERHRKYVDKKLLNKENLKNIRFAKKMYLCKCGGLMVCGRKCYKIAWSRNNHRQTCWK